MLLGLDVTGMFSTCLVHVSQAARWLDDFDLLRVAYTQPPSLRPSRIRLSQYERASKEDPYHVSVAPCRFGGDVDACAEDGEEECAYCDHGCAFRWIYASCKN